MADILIIDDDEDFASAAARVLRSADHQVQIELEVEKGLDVLRRKRPDLLVLDVMFPEDASAGFEAARELRRHREEFGRIPILMLTAVNRRFPLGFSSGDIDESWLPVSDFLEKPVDFDLLLQKVDALLGEESRPAHGGNDT